MTNAAFTKAGNTSAISVKLGARARAQIERGGLRPADITCIPAAAGGPKGLALIPLDRWLFGDWFARAQHAPTLIGASIGAWRMAAAAQSNPAAALDELTRTYIEDQVYSAHPPPTEVAKLIRLLARSPFVGGPGAGGLWSPRAEVSLRVVTARAAGALHHNASRLAFAKASVANFIARPRLAKHLRRVVFTAGPVSTVDAMLAGADPGLGSDTYSDTYSDTLSATHSAIHSGTERNTGSTAGFDAFGAEQVALTAANAEEALLGSGSIPLICDPVKVADTATHMPPGWYWDGGLIDYHLYYPYHQLDGLVLYPHFIDSLIPGWLDKFVPWRKQGTASRSGSGGNSGGSGNSGGNAWLSNMILISPSREFLRTLPNGKLPDRNDFYRYGLDHARRITDWKRAVAECGRFAEQAAAWLQAPDLSIARNL